MITLIEIFDPKQYENIISPVLLSGISKVIYIGSKEIMTQSKVDSLRQFYKNRKFHATVEFLYVERDNSTSIKNRLKMIINNNENCIFDATGGEDVILANVGIIAERYSVPIIRINTQDSSFVTVHGKCETLRFGKNELTVTDFVTLQGGEILYSDVIDRFTDYEIEDIKTIFRINSSDCEAYSAFCNIVSEYITQDKKALNLNLANYRLKASKTHLDIEKIKELFVSENLITQTTSDGGTICYRIKSLAVADCLNKSGNVLEYYTALVLCNSPYGFKDIKVGVNMDWSLGNSPYDTRNEVDVMAVINNFPVFISCKNGEVKKDALYELDTVSQRLGGAYAKKVMVCTNISKNKSARAHFIKRARDMGITLIFDVHKKSNDEFNRYLSDITG